jgi:hypothetical protein
MIDKSDPFYGAMLVESVRLHLGTVMAGQGSEIFFGDMLRLIDARVHYGYKTIRGRDAKLNGIKDFVHNTHYGLGVRDMATFLCAVEKSAYKERSAKRYGYQFIDWLKAEDPAFDFPEALFQYRRLMRLMKYNRKASQKHKFWQFSVLRFLYQNHPELLDSIGAGKKYDTVDQCYYGEGLGEKMETLKPIKIFKNPTVYQVEQVADILFERLGRGKTRVLICRLIDKCKNASAGSSGNGNRVSNVGTRSTGTGRENGMAEAET